MRRTPTPLSKGAGPLSVTSVRPRVQPMRKTCVVWADRPTASDAWHEVINEAELREHLLKSKKPVVLKWYAPWCQSCQRSYPEVGKMMYLFPDKLYNSFEYVKINLADLPKAWVQSQRVKNLPCMSYYHPGEVDTPAVTWEVPQAKAKFLRQNLQFALEHPGEKFTVDANMLFMVAEPTPALVEEAQRTKV
eukprot:CAMPEP_0119102356 /NCGR_PEP_ID=MMETSP1180-20130426/1133_1 /TAXON_ID=3052 ORGANISM="Chlamydomonas cf sp, Strain CCMP681" /NCGR_SAMPLE_ID=MMETSP1180 /ASSEMBLY_ACC=CAM_ASM_000741 /LENGTH=190 /DNA_ID=CAMNT_0007086633 /DNA_START=96 /DNA_END=668 /DNA_ORIENTATION=-